MTSSGSDSVVQPLFAENDPDLLTGYACQNVLDTNQVMELSQVVYMDILSKKGGQTVAIEQVQQSLVESIASRYQISSGIRCIDLPVDGSTWIVEFTVSPNDFVVDDTFDGCRSNELKELAADTASSEYDCSFYQVTVRGSYVGTTNKFTDLVAFLERTINSDSLTEELNDQTPPAESGQPNYFQTVFQGVPQSAEEAGGAFLGNDDPRDNLSDPTNLQEQATAAPKQSDRTTITIVGGLLVAAFGVAFVLIGYIFWRRRQTYVNNRSYQLDNNSTGGYPGMDKMSVANEADPDIPGPYNTSNTDDLEEEEFDNNGNGFNHNLNEDSPANMSNDSSVYLKETDVEGRLNRSALDTIDGNNLSSPTDGGNAMQFDLGNSFKDQLMGLHGKSGNNTAPKRSSGMNFLPGSLFTNRESNGPASLADDSDADSWAQTDGTIGSLELQLEPITAEV